MLAYTDEEIIAGVLAEFEPLAAIPRPSHHEKAVSDYLKGVFEALGCKVVQDKVYNIIAEQPGTEGYEDAPRTILQAHMDMVCVAEEGVEYDPLRDSIRLLRQGDKLTAEGTSLGADDGVGIATIIYLMKHSKKHGPLRAIITVDEEDGMSGAQALEAEHLQEAQYMINCDSEDWDLLTVGSAGSADISFSKTYVPELAKKEQPVYKLCITGLQGGHSGEEINSGAANAIQVLGYMLQRIQAKGVELQLRHIQGGRARNVIPSSAVAVFNTAAKEDMLQRLVAESKAAFDRSYGGVETGAEFSLSKTEATSSVAISEADVKDLLRLLVLLPNGVSAMSTLCPGLVQSSANIGVLTTDVATQKLSLSYMPRSAVDTKLQEYQVIAQNLSEVTGFQVHLGTVSPGWAERKDSRLAALMGEIFAAQNQQPMRVATIHAGLECSWHLQKNPELDVVSIGTNNNDIHSPKETLELWTIPPQVRLIEETLRRIK